MTSVLVKTGRDGQNAVEMRMGFIFLDSNLAIHLRAL